MHACTNKSNDRIPIHISSPIFPTLVKNIKKWEYKFSAARCTVQINEMHTNFDFSLKCLNTLILRTNIKCKVHVHPLVNRAPNKQEAYKTSKSYIPVLR